MLFSFPELQRLEINIRDYNQNEIDQIKLPNYDDRPSMQVGNYFSKYAHLFIIIVVVKICLTNFILFIVCNALDV